MGRSARQEMLRRQRERDREVVERLKAQHASSDQPFPFANQEEIKEEAVGKFDLPEIDLPETSPIKKPSKKLGQGGVSVFGADMDIMAKKKLEARQYLNSANRKPGESIQSRYSSTGTGTEEYPLDDPSLGANLQFGGTADPSSRTPFVRMWTAVQLQTATEIQSWHKMENKNRKREPEKYSYTTRGNRVYENQVNSHDRMIYMLGNYNLNLFSGKPNEPRTGDKLGQLGEKVLPREGKALGTDGYEDNKFHMPPSGITACTSEDVGPLGLMKRTTVNFTINNFHDYENIYQRYFLRPGAMLFVDFGWSTTPLYDPKMLSYSDKKQGLEMDTLLYGEGGVITVGNGDIQVIQGVVTEFDSKLTAEGVYECSVEMVSRNSALLEASFAGGQQSQKKMLLATIDASVLNFAAKHFGPSILGKNKMYDYAQAQAANEVLYTFGINKLKSQAVSGRNATVKSPASKEVLVTGVYWQTHYAQDPEDSDNPEEFKEVPGDSDSIYIMWGLLEDLILNQQFGFGRDDKDVLYGNDVSIRFDSSNSYVTYEPKLELSTFVDKSGPFTFRYPNTWDNTYNTYRSKVPWPRLSPEGKYHKSPGIGTWTELDKSMRRIPLREVFVNLGVVKTAIEQKQDVKSIVKAILDELKKASSDIWSLELGSARKDGSQVAIIDRNFVQAERDDTGYNGYLEKMFVFRPHSPDSIVKDMNLSFGMPKNDMGNMIAIQSGGAGSSVFAMDKHVDRSLALSVLNEIGQDLSVQYLPSMGSFPMEKFQAKISEGYIVDSLYNDEDKIFAGNSENSNQILSNFSRTNTRGHWINATKSRLTPEQWKEISSTLPAATPPEEKKSPSKDDDADTSKLEIKESDYLTDTDQLTATIQEYYKMLAKASYFYLNTSTLLPIEISLTIDGISTLNIGNLFRVDYLPKMYRESVYFQITSVKHNVSQDVWTTTIDALMRVSPVAKNNSELFAESSKIYLSKKALTDGLEVNITNKASFEGVGKSTELFPFISKMQVLGRGDNEFKLGFTKYLFVFEGAIDYLIGNGDFTTGITTSSDDDLKIAARQGNIHWGYIWGADAGYWGNEWQHKVDFYCGRFQNFIITGLQDDKVSGKHGGMGWDYYYNKWACNIKTGYKYIIQVSQHNNAVIYPYPETSKGGLDENAFKMLRWHIDGIFHMYSGLYSKRNDYRPVSSIWSRMEEAQAFMEQKTTGWYERGKKPSWINKCNYFIKSVAGYPGERFETD